MSKITHNQQLINQKERDIKYNTHMVKCKYCGEKSLLRTKDPLENDDSCWNVMCVSAFKKREIC